jgi:hypothetical protein
MAEVAEDDEGDGGELLTINQLGARLALGTPHRPAYYARAVRPLIKRGLLQPCDYDGEVALLDLHLVCVAKILATLLQLGFSPGQMQEAAPMMPDRPLLRQALDAIRAGSEQWHLQLWLEPGALSEEGWQARLEQQTTGREGADPLHLEQYVLPVLHRNLTNEPIRHALPSSHTPAVMVSLHLNPLLAPILAAASEAPEELTA